MIEQEFQLRLDDKIDPRYKLMSILSTSFPYTLRDI